MNAPKTVIDILGCYSLLTSNCSINQLGPPFTFYLSEYLQSNIYCKNVLSVDLKSAYPNICKIYFGKNSEFTKEVFSKPNKFERNKFISITLKEKSQRDGNDYLADFVIIAKLIILGYIYTKFENITIIEYVRDGAIIKYEYINSNFNNEQLKFLKFIQEYDLIFHEDEINSYLRINRTTYTKTNNDLIIKGHYKNSPPFILETINNFLNGKIYDHQFLKSIKTIYSSIFSKIIMLSGMVDEINHFYSFNGTYLDSSGKLSDKETFDVKAYLVYIIYPILSLLRLNQKNI